MSKKRAIVYLSLSAVLAGCGSEPTKPAPTAMSTAAAPAPTIAPKGVEKPTAAAPTMPTMPAPPMPMAVWDAPVDGRPKFMTVRAEGVQIYQCKKTAAGYAWELVAPEALLYNEKGRAIGKHGAGPSWQLSDGSKVVAAKKIGSKPSSGSIDWLLLKSEPPSGTGTLTKVRYVERIDTSGGGLPTMPADAAHENKEERVPYRATYVFYAGG